MKIGDTIKITSMDDPYAHLYIGKIGKITAIETDPWGDTRIGGTWGGIYLYLGKDNFDIIPE